ncbi:MAG: S8 family serine peptidase [Gammaproteobacteria bacterium]|nr:S8 family serine peptidase [Gammaproteobacteria bacterium]
MSLFKTVASSVLLVTVLSACGGGGGGGGDNGNTTPVVTLTLNGTVNSAAGSAADSDVNDPAAVYVPNDIPAQAQSIPNPVILGGYLNVANTGPAGPSFIPGDQSDFFRINLAANQGITVNIADFSTGDLDLYLYFDDGSVDVLNPDFASAGIGQTEALTVPSSGDYIIEVFAFTGYTNYALVVGQSVASLKTERLVSTDNFVPGEVVVRFKDNALKPSTMHTSATRAASLGLQFKSGANGRAMLLGLEDSQNRQASIKALNITSAEAGSQPRKFRSAVPEKQLQMDTLQMIKSLRKRSDVLYAEPNYILQATQTPTDDYYSLQWHYPLINLPSAWDVTTGVSNVTVAVIDTGVLLNHPDLQGQFSVDGGYDFIIDEDISQDGEPGIDANPDDPGDSTIGSSSFHGTHVAGTIAAATSFGPGGIGVAGVAPGVKIMPVRVLGNGGGTSYDVLQGVRYAAGLSNDSGIILTTDKADIINLSLGDGAFSQIAQDTYTEARNAGVIIVAAAGNESSNAPAYPASYDGVISVSAVDINKQLAPYSNFGTTVDVAAPGGDASQDVNGDGYGDGVLSTLGDDSGENIVFTANFYQGTSMASPHMAGVVALMKSVYSGLTPDNVDSSLSSGQMTQDLGEVGRDDLYGHGLIGARKAVDVATSLASGPTPVVPFLSITPASLNFGLSDISASLSVVNGGSGTLNITSVTVDAAWLTVMPGSVDASTQLGSYQVTVSRSSLAVGTYTASITIESSAGTNTVPVIMQVAGQDISADLGYLYILMIDADTNEFIEQWDGNTLDGNYNFQFDNVIFSSGQRIFIVAGTDLNNDGFICDAGEACGAYISLDQPIDITAIDGHSGLDFTSSYSTGLQSLSAKEIRTRGIAIRRLQTKQVQSRQKP